MRCSYKTGTGSYGHQRWFDFDSLDDEPVNLLFLIAAPNTEDNIHLDVLSKLSMLLMDENFVENLKNASSVDEFLQIVRCGR